MNAQIVLIDDDDDDRLVFREAVKNSGIDAVFNEYATGEEFISHLNDSENTMSRLVFLDINMPKTNGYTLLDMILKNQRAKECHIVMYTTSNSPHDIQFAEQNNASGFAAKPSDYNKLEELVKKAVTHFFSPKQDKAIFFSML